MSSCVLPGGRAALDVWLGIEHDQVVWQFVLSERFGRELDVDGGMVLKVAMQATQSS